MKLLRLLLLQCDRLHLLWGQRELDSRHPDTAYILQRLLWIESEQRKLLHRCRCCSC